MVGVLHVSKIRETERHPGSAYDDFLIPRPLKFYISLFIVTLIGWVCICALLVLATCQWLIASIYNLVILFRQPAFRARLARLS